MKRVLLFLIFSLVSIALSFAQAPSATCAGAPTVIVNGPCVSSVTVTDNAMEAGVNNANICGSGAAQVAQSEGWYRFQANFTQATITVNSGNRNLYLQVFSGACGALTEIGCSNTNTANNSAQTEATTVFGLTIGNFYYIRVGNIGTQNMSITSLCVTAPVPPANDNPCSATPLVVSSSCSYATYTNLNATNSAPAAPPCAGYLGGDVWFTVTVPASGTLDFDTQTGVMLDGGMAVYSGTCASLTMIACDDNNSPNGAMPMLNLTGLTPGATLWIRVWENGNNNNGTFGICVTNPFAPVNPGDCPNAINVCSNTSFGVTPSGPGATVEYTPGTVSDPGANPNCCNSGCHLAGELNTTWLRINIQTSGMLQFSFGAAGGAGCYDWVMWGPYTASTCANILGNTQAPIACNWNATCQQFTGMANPLPVGGNPGDFEQPIAVTAGQQYVISFSNYSGLTTNVPLNFFGTATIGCGPLPIELQDFWCNQTGNRMTIEWITSAEVNNNYFVIQRSNDNNQFEDIGVVVGSGNSNSATHYSFVDETPKEGANYYRLKQVDYDGHAETYQVSSCEFTPGQEAEVNIYNMTGQVIQTIRSRDYKYDVNALVLPAGMYVIEIISGTDRFYQTHYHGEGGNHWYGE